ncbi:MAG: HlyD family efflux transporter periplasmic adaptor subunit, partial [Pseudomonadota bacterium]
MNENRQQPKGLSIALEDHGAEGISILTSEPRRLILWLIYLVFALLVAGFAWSFIGRADVIVRAEGKLAPESDVRRVYAPAAGELVDIYMAEGRPVSKGDVLARINSSTAIEAATRALDAKEKLRNALQKRKLFPAQKKAMEHKISALKVQLEAEEQAHQRRTQESIAKLAEQQKLNLQKSRALLEKAEKDRELARSEWQKYVRLYNRPGHGGVSKNRVEQSEKAYEGKRVDYELAKASLHEFEIKSKAEITRERDRIQKKSEFLESLYIQYEEQSLKLEEAEGRVEMQVRIARNAAEGAARVTFEDIDEDNFLRIKAPVSGVLTNVAFTQIGDKVDAKTPIAGIAPEDARMVLQVAIPERDRGFLKEGMKVKLKFNAFPYQRYGFIQGVLEYIAPSTSVDKSSKKLIFKGRISLEHNYFSVESIHYPLRYGMTASAEIVVRKRRLIDMALDPLRKVAASLQYPSFW